MSQDSVLGLGKVTGRKVLDTKKRPTRYTIIKLQYEYWYVSDNNKHFTYSMYFISTKKITGRSEREKKVTFEIIIAF